MFFFKHMKFRIQARIKCIAINGFDNQERNLTFQKMRFQVLKLKFHVCNFKQAFHPLHKLHITWPLQYKNTFMQAFRSVPGCQTCMQTRHKFIVKKYLIALLFYTVGRGK